MSASIQIPFFDRNVEHVPVSKVRYMNTADLRELDHPVLIHGMSGPVAVLLSYESWGFLQSLMQKQMSPILDSMKVVGVEEGS
jgi:hypothetical protein